MDSKNQGLDSFSIEQVIGVERFHFPVCLILVHPILKAITSSPLFRERYSQQKNKRKKQNLIKRKIKGPSMRYFHEINVGIRESKIRSTS